MWIAEVFESIQGEGRYLAIPSGFIRTSGCNLRCWFCDTPYTSWNPEGKERSIASLLAEAETWSCQHAVVTGGEPLLSPEIASLTQGLRDRGFTITIETAGTISRADVLADLMSISPKRSNSTPRNTAWEQRHEQRRHRPEVIRHLTSAYDYQLKFVIDTPEDIRDVDAYMAEFSELDPAKIYLMPQGTQQAGLEQKLIWIREAASRRGWNVTPRLHIELFGNQRGT
jgi:7-carboxy-7-deazaguanine synthase